MAEVDSFNSQQQAAGKKLSAGWHNALRCAIVRMPVTFAAVPINDTVRTGLVIPRGSRLLSPIIRNSAGTASSTLDIGLRSARSGTVLDATALASAHAITTASGGVLVISGTKLAAGVNYEVAEDAEVYFTAKGAALAANQALEVVVRYLAP
ncbi:MAG: hypothetical protein IT480_10740 [Gammaproteobacteria bacterium]|nr:hypothetical protein [Gammaproteobacteria bacterium]